MNTLSNPTKVQVMVNRRVTEVWDQWVTPAAIMQWNIPFDNWHAPRVENNPWKQGEVFVTGWKGKTEKKALSTRAFTTRLSKRN